MNIHKLHVEGGEKGGKIGFFSVKILSWNLSVHIKRKMKKLIMLSIRMISSKQSFKEAD